MSHQPYKDRSPAEISDREELAPGIAATHDRRSEASRTMQGAARLDRRGRSAGKIGKK